MTNTEKINFNISPKLKKDIERLASSYGKSLSAFMLDICNQLSKANADRIKQQAQREKEPINFGDVVNKQVTPKKSRKKDTTKANPPTTEKVGDDIE